LTGARVHTRKTTGRGERYGHDRPWHASSRPRRLPVSFLVACPVSFHHRASERMNCLGGAVKAFLAPLSRYLRAAPPDLYRYCRHLRAAHGTAEDVAQETMARAFVTLRHHDPNRPAPPAGVAVSRCLQPVDSTNAPEARAPGSRSAPTFRKPSTSAEPRATREAAGTLIAHLSPQRASCGRSQDAFDCSLEESPSALHDDRSDQGSSAQGPGTSWWRRNQRKRRVEPAVLDAFCDAFERRATSIVLTALSSTDATMEYVPLKIRVRGPARQRREIVAGAHSSADPDGGTTNLEFACEIRRHRGGIDLLWWCGGEGTAVVRVGVERRPDRADAQLLSRAGVSHESAASSIPVPHSRVSAWFRLP